MSSSDLLQQAIVDATALKEAAIKNAATTLIEKYSQEFNKTVQQLIEQETPAAAPAAPADPAMAVPPPTGTPEAPLAADPAAATIDPAAVDPMGAAASTSGATKDAFSSVPGSFSEEDDNKLIEINFDQLEATLNEMLSVEERFDASSEAPIRDALRDGGSGSQELTEEDEEDEDTVADKEDEESDEDTVADDEDTSAEIFDDEDSEEIDLGDMDDEGEESEDKITVIVNEPEETGDSLGDGTALMAVADEPVGGAVLDLDKQDEVEEYEYELEEGQAEDAAVLAAEQKLGIVKSKVSELQAKKVAAEQAMNELQQAQEELAEAEKVLVGAKAAQSEANAREEQAQKSDQGAQVAAKTPAPVQTESIELSEEELEELAEELKVDMKVGNLSDGYMGSTETQKREQRAVELAAARDMKAVEEREEEVEKMADLMSENKDLKVVNNKLLSTIESMKLQLEKMNVSNAKLLYTNKALANVSLNERQKNQIVESISKAGSVLEAKAVFEALQSTVESLEKQEKAPQSLSEALNRAATPFVTKKSTANSVNDLMAERLKALAGIKK